MLIQRLRAYKGIPAKIKQLEIYREQLIDDTLHESPSQPTFINKAGESEFNTAVQTSGLSDPTFSKTAKILELSDKVDKEIKNLRREKELLDTALSILDEDEKVCIIETYMNNTKQRKICNMLNVSMDTVSRYKRRALNKMQKHLDLVKNLHINNDLITN